VADLVRSGLLAAETPLQPTGIINAAPEFRSIPPEIYNGLPLELISIVGGPQPPVDSPVALASDGQGTLLHITGAAPVSVGQYAHEVTITYDQLVPRPFCAEGPGDWLLVSGPVDFTVRTEVTADGTFTVAGGYDGVIMAQPIDLTSGDPVPAGDPFTASVSGMHRGHLMADKGRIMATDRRLTHEANGPQLLHEWLSVPQQGHKTYRSQLRCIDDE
jgi:hypothetical protein